MAPFFSYTPKTTAINFPWPSQVTGIERISLSAQGGLQRLLSAFFARPISIALVYSSTSFFPTPETQTPLPLTLPNPTAIASASRTTPIVQTRQVHLQCSSKTVCTATSTVRITSPLCAHLFLEEKHAIGQMFTRLEKVPNFELVSVGIGEVRDTPPAHAHQSQTSSMPNGSNTDGELTAMRRGSYSSSSMTVTSSKQSRQKQQLWRKYRLTVDDFECDILEVFSDREMFVHAEKWLDADTDVLVDVGNLEESGHEYVTSVAPFKTRARGVNVNLYLLLGFVFLIVLQLFLLFDGRCSAVY